MARNVTIDTANRVGAITAELFYIGTIVACICGFFGEAIVGLYLKIAQLLLIIPLYWLLSTASRFESPSLYYIEIYSLMLFLPLQIIKTLLFDFKVIIWRWADLVHVTLLFLVGAAMLGIAAYGSDHWKATTIASYFVMVILITIGLLIL